MDYEKIYLGLPTPAQNLVCSLKGWQVEHERYGPGFRAALQAAEQRTFWPAEKLKEFQNARLREIVAYAARHVPWYRRAFAEHRVPVAHVRSIDDLAEYLPVLTKEEIQAHTSDFFSDEIPPSRRVPMRTSGTTGGGLRFFGTSETSDETWACWWRYRRWHGIQLKTWCGLFGGRSIVPPAQTSPPFWRINYPARQVLFSAYHATAHNLDSYLLEIQRRRLPWLHGYPSQLALLAERALSSGIDLRAHLRWITIGAENLLTLQADLITHAFGVAPIQHYGQNEAVANISECPERRLHVDEDYSAVEMLAESPAGPFRVIGTALYNKATVMLRYDTQDLVAHLPNEECKCGRSGRVVAQIDGRREDYVVLANGARVGRMDHIFKDMVNIREAQIAQRRDGTLTFRVVRRSSYNDDDERRLLEEARRRLGDTDIALEYVDALPRTATGKLRFVISEMEQGQLNAVAETKSA